MRGPVFRRKVQRRNVQRYASGLSVRAPCGFPARRGPPSGGLVGVVVRCSAGHPPKAAANTSPPHLLGLLPAGPWRRWRLSPGPPRQRAWHRRHRPTMLGRSAPGGPQSPGPVSGVLVRPLWVGGRPWPPPPVPEACGPYWAGSPFRHPVGGPQMDGPPPPLLRGKRRGRQAGQRSARFRRQRRPRRFPR